MSALKPLKSGAKKRLVRSERKTANPRSAADYMSQADAIAMLGVKPATLYSYVSRGLVERTLHPDRQRSLYLRQDIEKLKARSDARAGHGVVAADALRWGEPVFPTAITEITPMGPRYRGRLATELAASHVPFENVAELLWSGVWLDEPVVWEASPPADIDQGVRALANLRSPLHIHHLFTWVTLAHGVQEGTRLERIQGGGTPIASSRRLIRAMAGCFGYLTPARSVATLQGGETIAQGVVRVLTGAADDERSSAVDAALVLCADHELNPSTFAARVAASSGADLHACIAAGIGTHSGALIGRACDKVEDLIESIASDEDIRKRLAATRRSGRRIPGFNHRLYPQGDPRGAACIGIACAIDERRRRIAKSLRLLEIAQSEFAAFPSVEAGLAILCQALRLPPRAAGGLFALARTAGWVAHILEQRVAGYILRPRARFTPSGSADAPARR